MRKKYIIAYLFMIWNSLCIAQYTAIPDSNFRNYIETYHPAVLSPDARVIDSLAAEVTGILSCEKRGIRTMDGVQKFYNITILNCSENNLTRLDSVGKLTALEGLYMYGNDIARLPDLSSLQSLKILECHGNELDSIKGLNNLMQLEMLVAGLNKFEKMPVTGNLPNLKSLQFWANRIDTIPDISGLTNLETFDFNNNKLRSLPDFTAINTLKFLKVRDNFLVSLPSLSHLPLQEMDITNNFVTQFPDISSSVNSLRKCLLTNNAITDLPDLSAYTNLQDFDVTYNYLTFQDLLPLAHKGIANFKYDSQREFGQDTTVNITEYTPFEWNLDIDNNVTSNKYEWYKDGQLLSITYTNTLAFNGVKKTDAGQYTCRVRNANLPDLILKSKTLTLNVQNCNCDNVIIEATNPDPNKNTIQFLESGEAKIYDKYGKLVRKLKTPTIWDGTVSNNVEPGLYVVTLNDRIIKVTVIK